MNLIWVAEDQPNLLKIAKYYHSQYFLNLFPPEEVILEQKAGHVPGLGGVEAEHQEAAVPAGGGQEAPVAGEGEVRDAALVGELLASEHPGHLVTEAVILTDIGAIISGCHEIIMRWQKIKGTYTPVTYLE